MTSPVQNNGVEWEVDSKNLALKSSNSNFDASVDKTAECSRPPLNAGANAFVAQSVGGGFSSQVDDAVDCSVDGTSKAAKNWCVIS